MEACGEVDYQGIHPINYRIFLHSKPNVLSILF